VRVFAIQVVDENLRKEVGHHGVYLFPASFMSLEDLCGWRASEDFDAVLINLCSTNLGWTSPTIRVLRKENFALPIIGICRISNRIRWPDQRATFLEHGGDDLFKDPPDPRELAASLSAIVRRMKKRRD
jgi:DNA-binding response OmpR family regulator